MIGSPSAETGMGPVITVWMPLSVSAGTIGSVPAQVVQMLGGQS